MKTLWWDRPPYTADCPKCRSGRGLACRTPLGKARAPHPERWTAADGYPIPGLELEAVL